MQFDKHTLGGGTEDVLAAWPRLKGNWTTKHSAILSMYMFAECFDWAEIRKEFGSLTYSFRYHSGGALDTLDQVTMNARYKSALYNSQEHDAKRADLSVTASGLSWCARHDRRSNL